MGTYIDTLVYKIKEEGKALSPKVKKSINDIGFRILEQVRLNNRDNVYHMLLRCFHSNSEKFPEELIEAFKPENEKYFKTLIFSFLAPILGEQKEERQKEGGES